MSLQEIYTAVGIVGFVLAAVFAVAAIVYFVRADIRTVYADLAGKTRQIGLAEAMEGKKPRNAKNVLTKDSEWQGRISHGDLEDKDDDAATDADESSTSDGVTSAAAASPRKGPKPVRFRLVRSEVGVHAPNVVDASGREVPYGDGRAVPGSGQVSR